ncbi:MAG: hypothetical protein ABW185_08420 [Sedimenticola sp.]
MEIKTMHESRMDNLERKVDNLGTEIRTEIRTELSDQIKNMKMEVTDDAKSNIKQVVEERIKEMDDRRRRESNLIIFMIPEKHCETSAKEKEEDELDIRKIASDLGLNDLDIRHSFRLGGKNKTPTSTRPIKIVVGTKKHRQFLLDNAKHIRTKVTARLIKAAIVKDLTIEQRNERNQRRARQPEQRRDIENQVAQRPKSPSIIARSQPSSITAQSTPARSQGRLPHLNMTPERPIHQLDETMIGDITVIGGISQIPQPISPDVERN